jgi:hypothetical protein
MPLQLYSLGNDIEFQNQLPVAACSEAKIALAQMPKVAPSVLKRERDHIAVKISQMWHHKWT